MPRVAEDAARLALMELAEAFGADESAVLPFLALAMDARLFLDDGKVVYRLGTELELKNGEMLIEVALREPQAADYVSYSGGMAVRVSRDGSSEIDTVMMVRRTMKAVVTLADQPAGIVDRFSVRDIRTLGEVCDALGFFE
jgi:hypothetical protein